MKYLALFFTAGILLLNPLIVKAQVSAPTTNESTLSQTNQEAIVEDVEGLRAEFKENVQNPETKIMKYEMILKAGIDSDRVKITWSLRGNSSFVDKSEATKNIIVKKGNTYSIAIEITPSGKGVTELIGKAEAFKVDGSYIATVRKNFATNSSGEILPLTSEYQQASTISTIKNILLYSIIIIILIVIAYFGYKKFKTWVKN